MLKMREYKNSRKSNSHNVLLRVRNNSHQAFIDERDEFDAEAQKALQSAEDME